LDARPREYVYVCRTRPDQAGYRPDTYQIEVDMGRVQEIRQRREESPKNIAGFV
jgi:hypothetical protein